MHCRFVAARERVFSVVKGEVVGCFFRLGSARERSTFLREASDGRTIIPAGLHDLRRGRGGRARSGREELGLRLGAFISHRGGGGVRGKYSNGIFLT